MTKRTVITSEQFTYLCMTQIAVDIQQIIEQYHFAWMPTDIKRLFEALLKTARKLETLADKKSGVEVSE